MAASTRSKKPSLGELLIGSPGVPVDPLRCEIPGNAVGAWDRTAYYLGLKNGNLAKEYLASPHFHPYYEELYENAIAPRLVAGSSKKQGPDLRAVQNALVQGEKYGDFKYSGDYLDKEGYGEVDWYAWALYRIARSAKNHRDGIFKKVQMSDQDIQARCWLAITRATKMRAPSKARGKKAHKKRTSETAFDPASIYSDTRVQDDAAAEASGVAAAPPSDQRHPIKKVKRNTQPSGPKSSQSSAKPPPSSQQDPHTPQQNTPTPAQRSPTPAQRAPSPSLFVNPNDRQASVEDALDEDDSQVYDTAEDDLGEDGTDERSFSNDPLERLHHSKNPENPYDLTTDYGKYISLHTVATHFGDKPRLMRLAKGPQYPEGATELESDDIDDQWSRELQQSLKGATAMDFEPATEKDVDKSQDLESLRDNPALHCPDYDGSAERLEVDPDNPRLPTMKLTDEFTEWQLPCVDRLCTVFKQKRIRAMINADATGLGKTWEFLGFLLKVMLERQILVGHYNKLKKEHAEMQDLHYQWEEDHEELQSDDEEVTPARVEESVMRDQNPYVVPELPTPPPPPKPKLIITLGDLIGQLYGEISQFSSMFRPYVYHGDTRSDFGEEKKITGLLTRDHHIFNPDTENTSNIIVITTLATLRARHGPGALKDARWESGQWTQEQLDAELKDQDLNWIHDLHQCFDIIVIDEAHCIKNPETMSNVLIQWLDPEFLLLATASVLPNRVEDWRGYSKLLQCGKKDPWTAKNFDKWGLNIKTYNPFEDSTMTEASPRFGLLLSATASEKFITGAKADKTKAGQYLRKIWPHVMIRRTYQSPNPKTPEKKIGESIAALHTRRINCEFSDTEFKVYQRQTQVARKYLCKKLPDGTLVWNRKYSRELILNSTWLGWHFIEEHFTAREIEKWKSKPDCLWQMINLLHKKMSKKGIEPKFIVPEKDDILSQLAIICRGSPKLRATLRMVAELVVLEKRKLVFFCSLPANQLLLHAVFQALKIDTATYTADLNRAERQKLVGAFTEDTNGTYVWVGSYYVGSYGLNLQELCNHCVEWDGAPSQGARTQAIGRVRRIGQRYTVESFEITVRNSFQNRVCESTLMKSIPGAIAELTLNIDRDPTYGDDDRIGELEIGKWFWLEDEKYSGILVRSDDPRAEGLKDAHSLSPEKFVEYLLQSARGEEQNHEITPAKDKSVEVWQEQKDAFAQQNLVLPQRPKFRDAVIVEASNSTTN